MAGASVGYTLTVTNTVRRWRRRSSSRTSCRLVSPSTRPAQIRLAALGWCVAQLCARCSRGRRHADRPPSATIDAAFGGASITNVRGRVRVPDPNPSDDAASATTTLGQEADLLVTKVADATEAPAGGQASFTLSVTNEGPSTATAASLVDTLPPGLSAVSVRVDPTRSCTQAAGVVTCALGTLTAGESVTVVVVVSCRARRGGDGHERGPAASAGSGDPDPANNAAPSPAISYRADG